MDSSIEDLEAIKEFNETDTEILRIVSPTKKDSKLDKNINEKRCNGSVKYSKSIEIRDCLSSKEKKM